MKRWENPSITQLHVSKTEAGGLGGTGDGVTYKAGNHQLIGTSGPALDLPTVP